MLTARQAEPPCHFSSAELEVAALRIGCGAGESDDLTDRERPVRNHGHHLALTRSADERVAESVGDCLDAGVEVSGSVLCVHVNRDLILSLTSDG